MQQKKRRRRRPKQTGRRSEGRQNTPTSFVVWTRSEAVPPSLGHSNPRAKVLSLISALLSTYCLTMQMWMHSAHKLSLILTHAQTSKTTSGTLVSLHESASSPTTRYPRRMMHEERYLNAILQLLGPHHSAATHQLHRVQAVDLVLKIHPSLSPVILFLSYTHPLPRLHPISLTHHFHVLVLFPFLFPNMLLVIIEILTS
ncbi:hypothetical protein GYMLUDRAFT_904828 [Collybiopsis luxurians FD-317 M1]|uniref:Unplaced genomic scaffold GYMLUscaffold_68, whole genome shotgun sequence n=1 Tax=Collybiopsis luxurians FD-317 M1 TaxID=944289 RepID=A0A0D0BXB4_9AGAR|nr:hypothetical protein GYMLUDRAFT_904828 [Collybiopsis luxurians FD-317 M1]